MARNENMPDQRTDPKGYAREAYRRKRDGTWNYREGSLQDRAEEEREVLRSTVEHQQEIIRELRQQLHRKSEEVKSLRQTFKDNGVREPW